MPYLKKHGIKFGRYSENLYLCSVPFDKSKTKAEYNKKRRQKWI